MKTKASLLLAALVALPRFTVALERLEPAGGCYFGVNLGQNDTIERLRTRLGVTPAVYVQFFHFPLTPASRADLNSFLDQVRPTRGIALITLEPFQGLGAVTEEACLDLAGICATNEALDIGGIIIRFAHEMNGNWYPWCQQPALYKEKFRLLSGIVRTNTVRTAMLWAPHNGIGYPFASGLYQAAPGSADFAALDTNGDGALSPADDMYEPYYPGDDAVDWVGMTVYHWGVTYPWLENEMPPTNSFFSTLTGAGHQPAIPNFYARYCADGVRNKPLAVPETSAFYNPQQPAGAGEFLIKQAWWRQVFNVSDEYALAANIATQLPKLKCVNWFDHYKPEAEAQGQWIDWRISAHPVLREAFIDHLRQPRDGRPYFLTAQEFDCQQRGGDCVLAERLPRILPLNGSVAVTVTAVAQADCDLVVDLLDFNYLWKGGTRAAVNAGTQTVTLYLTINEMLGDGWTYRWSIFLTPTGSNHLGAVAWCDVPGPTARAIRPAIEIVGYAPSFTPGSNFMVKVKYTSAASYAVAQVNILDGDYNWHGGATISVPRGDGLLDVTVSPQGTLSAGSYSLECFLSDSPTNWQQPMARSPNVVVQAAPAIAQDFIQALPQPSAIPAGEVFRFLVTYAASGDRDLHVDLLNADNNFLAGTVQRVGASSGVQEMTISHPWATAGTYRVNSFITGPSLTWTQALASGAIRELTVLQTNYTAWIEWRWGVVLGSDTILPGEDADADGANNEAERISHTAPLHPADVLRLNTTVSAGRIELSWRSASLRRYRVLESTDISSDYWSPFGDPIDGTGDTIQVTVEPQAGSAPKFFRLEVTALR